jgi:integrase
VAYRVAAHLKRNRFGVFYFRQVVPPDLRVFFAFKEISRSTGTSRRAEAAALAQHYGAATDLLFARLRELAKDKKQKITAELIVGLEFEKDGTLKSLVTDVQPGEEEAASRLVPQLLQVAQIGGGTGKPIPANGPRLYAEIEKYLDEQTRGANWRPQTALDVRGDFEQFKAVLGDIPVAALNHEALNRLRDTLLRLPANINKLPQTKGRTIEEILALGLPPQSPVTVKKKWTRLISFCDWLEGKGLVDKNYARGKKPKARTQSYDKFTRDDLARLFESEQYRTGSFEEPFQYWLPMLGLFTGARIEELAQLHVADIRQDAETAVWTLRITEEVDEVDGAETEKSTKNDHSTRLCPLHSALLDAGFTDYINDLKARGYDRVFPELAQDAIGKVGPRASEWFTEYRRAKGVGAFTGRSRKVFHSFRHTMNSSLQRAGVPQELREALCGHATRATNIRIYGGGLTLNQLKGAIEKLDYGIALARFTARKEHEAARTRASRRAPGQST